MSSVALRVRVHVRVRVRVRVVVRVCLCVCVCSGLCIIVHCVPQVSRLLVLNLVSSTLPCIRQLGPRLRVLGVCDFV